MYIFIVYSLCVQMYFRSKCDLDRNTTHTKFDPTRIQTHDF